MSNVDKMCLRMLAWCFAPLIIAVPLAVAVSALSDAFTRLGASSPLADVSWEVAVAASIAGAVILLVQAIRIWRWKEGKSDACRNCGCLLGRERDGRWGPYRKCLACRANHVER